MVAGGDIWIVRASRQPRLLRFDTASAELIESVDLDYFARLIRSDDGSLWAVGPYGYVPGPRSYTVSRIDLETAHVTPVAEVPVGSVTVGLGSIWVAGPKDVLRVSPETGTIVDRRSLEADGVQVGCEALWAWRGTFDPGDDRGEGSLFRFDPTFGNRRRFTGAGPLFERSDGCWRWTSGGLEHLWPLPASTTAGTHASRTIWFEGSTFWFRPDGVLQRWDPSTGAGYGPAWTLNPQDVSPLWKVGDDGIVVTAGGYVWLINGFEIVGFDIPAE